MPSLLELDSPPQIPAAGVWASLYDAVQEPVKPRHLTAVPAAAAAKKPAYGGRKKNLETCTEALGCETGAVDAGAAPPCNGADGKGDAEVEEAECAERKRRAREEEETEGRARLAARRPLPPPLTTLTRMVHERRDGRLAVYAVRAPGVEAERSGGRLRLRMRLVPLPSGSSAACRRQEPPEAEAKAEEEEGCHYQKYVRGGRCVEPEGAAAAARRGKQWEQEQAAAFWVATS